MKAAVYYETGAPSVFRYEEIADPTHNDAEILIKVEAISIEGGDTLNRLGGEMAQSPHVVGYQCAGTVVAVGAFVEGFAIGDRVVSLGLNGSHAELRVGYPQFTWPIPVELATDIAACIPTAYGTAHDALFEFGRLQAGETVLVHAGASGTGIAAIQLAKRVGARVMATASSDERLERLTAFGLDDPINYVSSNFVERVRELTGGRGADLIIDSVGGTTQQDSLRALAYRGRIVSFGNAGREGAAQLDVSTMGQNNQSLTGYFLGAELFAASRAHAMISTLIDDVAKGELRVVIDQRFTLSDAELAHSFIEDRSAFGRVVLVP
jgi:NADPH2:quinone reductase